MIYVVKKGVKNDAHDTKNDKSVPYMAKNRSNESLRLEIISKNYYTS